MFLKKCFLKLVFHLGFPIKPQLVSNGWILSCSDDSSLVASSHMLPAFGRFASLLFALSHSLLHQVPALCNWLEGTSWRHSCQLQMCKNLIRESETSSKSHFLRKKFQDFESCWQVTSHTADFPKFPDYSLYSEVNLQKKVLIILRNIRTFVVGSLKKQIRPLLQFFPKILQLCFSTAKS